MTQHLEIERKWLLQALPALRYRPVLSIEQGYLSRNGYQVRVRRISIEGRIARCVLSRKKGRGLTRTEVEEPISNQAFDLLWPLARGHRLEKRRYLHQDPDGLVWEVDEYLDRLEGLYTVEVELDSEGQPFRMPPEIDAVVVKEVTGDATYLNSTLARKSKTPP